MFAEGFNVARFLVFPKRKVAGIIVESGLALHLLAQVADVLDKHGCITPSVQYNLSSDFKKIVGLVFLDLTNADCSIDELVGEIRKIKGIKGVRTLQPSADGFVADYLSVRLLLAGDRSIILRRPGYEGLIIGMREQFGTAGEVFLYHTGYEAGIKYGRSHQEIAAKLGIKDPIAVLQKISVPLYASMGLGKLDVVEASTTPPQVIMRVYDCFECELGIGAKKPFSNFIRGILAALIAQLFNRRMEAKELKCIAKGDSYCEFKITPE